jgi:hypothetical protein
VSQLDRLDRALRAARADLVDAERLLAVEPADEFAQMSVELFRSEVESYRQIMNEGELGRGAGETFAAYIQNC